MLSAIYIELYSIKKVVVVFHTQKRRCFIDIKQKYFQVCNSRQLTNLIKLNRRLYPSTIIDIIYIELIIKSE